MKKKLPKNSKILVLTVVCLVFIVFVFTLSISTNQAQTPQPSDIKNHWAKSTIASANSEGWAYVEGKKFNPNKAATREEVMWMLVGALKVAPAKSFDINKKTDLSKFKDKPSKWSEGRISIAVGNGLIKGYTDGTLKTKTSITRAEFAVIMSRLIEKDTTDQLLPFWDYIPKWALSGIKMAYSKGIIGGYPSGAFGANKNVTKAEALVMIKRWRDNPALQKPKLSKEYSELQTIFKDNLVLSDNMLYYYEKGYEKDKYDSGLFNITEAEYGYTIMINPKKFDEKNEAIYNNMLKAFYPNSYESAYKDMLQSIKDKSVIQEKTYDGKQFFGRANSYEITIYISK